MAGDVDNSTFARAAPVDSGSLAPAGVIGALVLPVRPFTSVFYMALHVWSGACLALHPPGFIRGRAVLAGGVDTYPHILYSLDVHMHCTLRLACVDVVLTSLVGTSSSIGPFGLRAPPSTVAGSSVGLEKHSGLRASARSAHCFAHRCCGTHIAYPHTCCTLTAVVLPLRVKSTYA